MKLYLNWMLVLLAIALSVICYLRGVQVNELQALVDTPAQAQLVKLPNGDVCVGIKVNDKVLYSCAPGVCNTKT